MVSKRHLLLGLGGAFIGSGALLGTGAFSTVQAQRSVALETADDSDAFLAFEVIDNDHVDSTDGTIGFELITNARTTFDDLVRVHNRGTQPVKSLRFEFSVTAPAQNEQAIRDALEIISGNASIPAERDLNLLNVSDAEGADDDELAVGEGVPFGIAVDLTGNEIDAIEESAEITLLIIADTEEGKGNGGQSDGSGDPAFTYSAGPTRDPPGTPPRSARFTIENVGSSTATLDEFRLEIDTPGNSPAPDGFEGFEIDPDARPTPITGGQGSTGVDVSHAPYDIAPGATAEYLIEEFDRDPSQQGELTLTLIASDGRRFELDPAGFQ